MNLQALETYILSKDFAEKKVIYEWRYIRYTIYANMFAALQETKKGIVLTVWGRFPHYEKQYSGVAASGQNDPLHYTDVRVESVPEHVVKAMIDYAYRERLRQVPMPQTPNSRFEDVPYCGIAPLDAPASEELTEELVATALETSEPIDYGYWEIKHSRPDDRVPQPEGEGRFDTVPYRVFNDEHCLEMLKKLLQAEKNDKETSNDT